MYASNSTSVWYEQAYIVRIYMREMCIPLEVFFQNSPPLGAFLLAGREVFELVVTSEINISAARLLPLRARPDPMDMP